MSENVVATMEGVSLPKGWEGDRDLGLSLGSALKMKEAESSTNCSSKQYNQPTSEENKFGLDEEAGSDCTTEEGSQHIPSSLAKEIGSGISQICAETIINNNNGAVGEVWQRKRAGKLSTSRYKGVVPQPKGRWGAQIYEKHRRVWLGTFNTEQEAAQSYDTAALKFRGHKAITNFAPLDDTHPEAIFLSRHSKAEIVDMLRKHTYREELQQSYTNNIAEGNPSSNGNNGQFALENERASFPREHLFDKTVTPSDVGKLNRLVIPKHHAQRCFPIDAAFTEKGLMLNFEDSIGKTWRFRYSYWNSSQSYVLTKGWSRYVKDKYLRAGDIVTFERSTGGCRQLFVGFRRRPCNFLPQKPTSAPSFLSPEFLPGYSGWTHHGFLPFEHNRSLISNEYIPWSDLAPLNFPSGCHFYSPMDSLSLNRKSSVLEYSNPPAKTFTSSTCPDSSNVTVFGVNLSTLSSSTLNLFPSTTADKDEPNDIDVAEQ
ncbi:hypothetical protein SUGI_0082700 [Cryptomeria japonica]|uniref:AP2/ERF and B3 domain-containing transcription factor RAV1 n=1 Tax=Cryptomeria japonica TaxID=3369 RepID=UPI002408AD19|nr:AP2/ERF and B3 domain-containing transcription factor RAV1 [Cryptomeria japonica]GLJ08169.1 hypothetical protein SUGI_0082700 [Cryptomeria japonica]